MNKTIRSFEDETDQACRCAAEQAAHDLPYTQVGAVRPYQYLFTSCRWYIEVDVHHWNASEGAATVLYRVWRRTPDSAMTAMKVDIREQALEQAENQQEKSTHE
jgi:hypothetical protein